MDDAKVADNTTVGNGKKVFGRRFGAGKRYDTLANGLLAVHRHQPVIARHYADHAPLSLGHVTKHIIPALLKRDKPPIKLVKLTGANWGGCPNLMYALTSAGHRELVRSSNEYWPEVCPEAAIGKFINAGPEVNWTPNLEHNFVIRDVLLAAERDAPNLSNVKIVDQVSELRWWGGTKFPTAIETPLGRRMKSDAANLMLRDGKSTFADEIEVDMGTEVESSNNPDLVFNTLEGKIKSYWSVLGAGLIKQKYGVASPIFRVLFITNSDTRAQNIAELAGTSGCMPIEFGKSQVTANDIFFTTTIEKAKAQFFGPHWLKTDGSVSALAKRIDDV